MRLSNFAVAFIILFIGVSLVGCGNDGNTVIEHSGNEETAEDRADYEAEKREMEAERD